MPQGKRYYYLKLQEDFFTSKRIKKLRKIAGGDTYCLIYFKMQLLSVRSGGILVYSGLEPTFAEEIALDIDEEPDNVAVTLAYLQSCGLIETYDDKEYLLPYAADNIGSESDSAIRVRKFRANHPKETKSPKSLQCNTTCNADVTDSNAGESKRNAIIDIEKDIDINTNSKDHRDDDIESENDDHDAKKVANDAFTSEFESIWKEYPNKQGKHNALKAFIKARKEGVPLENIENGLKSYRDHVEGTDKRYIKHGDTWFRGRYWEDDGIQEEDRETDLDDIFM